MNHIYRTIWNATLGTWIAVAENTCARGKPARAAVAALSVSLSICGAVFAAPQSPGQLPTGSVVVGGQAKVSQGGSNMVVNQTSQRAIINWDTFNVGTQATVNFQQPDANSVTLNRVLDTNPSQILGRVSANGQVFLTNPNGVYFGPNSSVEVGGLVATTHSIKDADFMAGKNTLSRNGATGSVVNDGNLKAHLGGYIALLAPEVINNGIVIAQLGTAALAAGEVITLNFENSSLAGITVTPAQIGTLVKNRQAVLAPGGTIIFSAQAANTLQGGVINNSGSLEANGMALKGGKIVLTASTRIENTGVISASASASANASSIASSNPGNSSLSSSNVGNTAFNSSNAASQGGPAGSINMSAPTIVNSGLITASGVTPLNSAGGGNISLRMDKFLQTSSGRIDASSGNASASGSISIVAEQDIDMSGSVTTQAAIEPIPSIPISLNAIDTPSAHGSITIKAGRNITFNNASVEASALDSAGSIAINSGPHQPDTPQDQQPHVLFLGNTSVRVNSRRGKAGVVTVSADNIALLDNTSIDASGANGGGTILIGGDAHGANPEIQNAQYTLVDRNVSIAANATEQGNGGKVVVWADQATSYAAHIFAKGGALAGSGGWVEVSGKNSLSFRGLVDTSAAYGKMGTLLLDPTDITISTAADTGTMTWTGGAFSYTDTTTTPSNLNTTTLQNQLALTNVVVSTASGLGGFGDITVSNPISWSSANSLTLQADRNIDINAAVSGSAGALSLNAPNGAITINAAVSGGPSVSAAGLSLTLTATGSMAAAGGGVIGINTDNLNLNIASTLQSPGGMLAIAPFTPATTIGISSGAGTLAITAVNFSNNFTAGFANIAIGDPTSGAITVGGVTVSSDSLSLTSNGAIAINAPLSVSGANTLDLASATSISGTGSITANGLSLSGGGPGVNVSLTSAGNNVGTIAATGIASLNFVNVNALTIGTVGPVNGITATGASAPINISTVSASLTVAQSISTSDTSATAIVLNANSSSAAGIAGGGDVVLGGGTITTGAGGTATIFTGSVAGSTGVAALVGAGNSRYNSNAGTSNYTTPLGASGIFAVFREQPVITVTANPASKTYNGLAFTGGAGASSGGFVNGDTSAILGGTLAYGGSAQGAINAGSYAIAPSGYTNGLGYAINYVNGTLTVSQTALTITASSGTKVYGSTQSSSSTAFTTSGLVNGETVGGVTLTTSSTPSGPGGTYTVTPSAASGGTFNPSNYTIAYVNGALTVTPASLTVTANSTSKTYDGLSYSGGAGVTFSGFVNGESSAVLGGSLNYGGSSQGSINAGKYSIVPSGFSSSNYTINYVSGDLIVSPARLSITANAAKKTYDGLSFKGGNGVSVTGFVNGETSSVLVGSLSYSGNSQSAINAGKYAITPSGLSSNNYVITYGDGVLTIDPAVLTITANAISKIYGATQIFTGTEFTSNGLANGETIGNVSLSTTSNANVANSPYAIVPSAASGGTFNPSNYTISYINGALTVKPAALTIGANAASKTYDGLSYSGGNGISYTGFVNGDTSSALTGILSYGGTSQAAINAGKYTIVPSGLNSNNYTITYVNGVLTINPAALTVTANAASKTYNGLAFTGGNGVNFNGLVNGETSAVLGGSLTFGGSSQGSINAGKYIITPSGFSSNNYVITYVNGELTVNPAALTVTANDASKTNDGLAYTGGKGVIFSGLVNGETSVVLGGTLTYSGSSQGAINTGKYVITPSGLTSNNYTISYVDGTLTIIPAPQVILPPTTTLPTVDVNPTQTGGATISSGTTPANNQPGTTTLSNPNVNDVPSSTNVSVSSNPISSTQSISNPGTSTTNTSNPSSTTNLATTIEQNLNNGVDGTAVNRNQNSATPSSKSTSTKTKSTSTSVAKVADAKESTRITTPTTTLAKNTTVTNQAAKNPTLSRNIDKPQVSVAVPRVQAAISNGVSPTQAERAGKAYTAAVTRELSKGATPLEAAARAEQVFNVVSKLPTPSTPQVAAVKDLAAGGGSSSNPIAALDTLVQNRMQASIAAGASPSQAERAGNAYSAAVVTQLSKGASPSEATARAEQVFNLVLKLPTTSSPQVAAVKNLAAVAGDPSKQLAAASKTQTSAGEATFNKVLVASLAKGSNMATAIQTAQAAGQRADALSKVTSTPRSLLAAGGDGVKPLSTQPASSQQVMGMLLNKGFSPEQSAQRAAQIAANDAAAVRADAANPAVSIATGKLSAMPNASSSLGSDKTIQAALARGVPIGEALKRAQQLEAIEQKAKETDARNPTAVFSNGSSAPALASPEFDRALSSAIARGESPAAAQASARLATAKVASIKPSSRTALASGDSVDAMLNAGSSRTYQTVLGNALARGIPVDKAMTMAKQAEQMEKGTAADSRTTNSTTNSNTIGPQSSIQNKAVIPFGKPVTSQNNVTPKSQVGSVASAALQRIPNAN